MKKLFATELNKMLILWMLGNYACFFCCLWIFLKLLFFKNIFQEYHQSVKQFGSRSGPTFCRFWSGSKLFAKAITRWQKSPLAGKELIKRRGANSFLLENTFFTEGNWAEGNHTGTQESWSPFQKGPKKCPGVSCPKSLLGGQFTTSFCLTVHTYKHKKKKKKKKKKKDSSHDLWIKYDKNCSQLHFPIWKLYDDYHHDCPKIWTSINPL